MTRLKLLCALILIASIGAVLSLFSSELPDGLEWVMTRTGLEGLEKTLFKAPLHDYTLPFARGIIGRVLSAFVGVAIVALASYIVAKLVLRRRRDVES